MRKWPFKILVKYASRGRPERFFGGMDTIRPLADLPNHVYVCVTADYDDECMNNESVIQRIHSYQNTKVIFGLSKNKVDAINRDMDNLPDEMKDWDILVNFSDDQRFVSPQWDTHIRVAFNSVSPDLDGYLSFIDPDTKGALTTTSIMGRPYYERFNFIYDPKFKSLFCDNLSDDCAKALGKYHFVSYQIIHHFNPAYGYKDFPRDEMFEEQQRIGWDEDEKTYYKIKAGGIESYLTKYIT